MILLDANVLLYAWHKASPHHDDIRSWLDIRIAQESIGLPWVSCWALLRISTNARLTDQPATAEDAFTYIRRWLANPSVQSVNPGPRHDEILRSLLIQTRIVGLGVTDAVLAAIAIENGATLASTDRGFARFQGLSWVDPLSDN